MGHLLASFLPTSFSVLRLVSQAGNQFHSFKIHAEHLSHTVIHLAEVTQALWRLIWPKFHPQVFNRCKMMQSQGLRSPGAGNSSLLHLHSELWLETQMKMIESVVLTSYHAGTSASPAFSGFFIHVVVVIGILAFCHIQKAMGTSGSGPHTTYLFSMCPTPSSPLQHFLCPYLL